MAKNILIFSDGTGQRGGQTFDERRSNIYKMFRATRCGPDSCINPSVQLAYYDPGLGTLPDDHDIITGTFRWIYNLISLATGMGITMNIIDCYTYIIQVWEPGDRIFLFGFSRGAYTVRCLAVVLSLCGIPIHTEDKKKIKRNASAARNIAKEAVKKVYHHAKTPDDKEHLPQREALAKRFRKKYGSDVNGSANAYPYFIGVFDTVSSLLKPKTLALAVAIILVAIAVLSFMTWWLTPFKFWPSFGVLFGLTCLGGFILFLINNIKYAWGLEEYSFWKTLHFSPLWLNIDNESLDLNVTHARHAISIDENRSDFQRVRWGEAGMWPESKYSGHAWFKQEWFAGNHSDIGGSYPENESRLSDIALEWMVEEARKIPNGIEVDKSVLQLYPSHLGIQHDERKTSKIFGLGKSHLRDVPPGATIHSSVLERFKAEGVVHYDETRPYRPENLRNHNLFKDFFT